MLFKCLTCEASPDPETFPFCPTCLATPQLAPPLCSNCAGLLCAPDACARPWISNAPIRAFHARYLLIEPGYSVLKRWKVQASPLLDRRVLRLGDELASRLNGFDAIIPVPQSIQRAWKLGGSPAERIARWISRQTKTPVHLALKIHSHRAQRQGPLHGDSRLANPLRYTVDLDQAPRPGAKILLVDDFMTTGHTLRSAARVLKESGMGRIEAFCLGVRPIRVRLE